MDGCLVTRIILLCYPDKTVLSSKLLGWNLTNEWQQHGLAWIQMLSNTVLYTPGGKNKWLTPAPRWLNHEIAIPKNKRAWNWLQSRFGKSNVLTFKPNYFHPCWYSSLGQGEKKMRLLSKCRKGQLRFKWIRLHFSELTSLHDGEHLLSLACFLLSLSVSLSLFVFRWCPLLEISRPVLQVLPSLLSWKVKS